MAIEEGDPIRQRQGHVGEIGVVRPPEFLEPQLVAPHEVGPKQLVPRRRVECGEDVVAHLTAGEHIAVGGKALGPQHPVRAGDLPGHVVVDDELAGHDIGIRRDSPGVKLFQHGGKKVVIRIEEREVFALRLRHP